MVNPSLAATPPRLSGAPLLEIEDLQVYYRTVTGVAKAVDGVSLTVNRGEILGIAGESGCGKSTLAGALLRLIRPPGYMNSLNPVMRVVDQFVDVVVEHGAGDAQEARELVPQLLQQVGLAHHVGKMFPHELSGGMKQRVIIAMAIALKPDLVIADEPTTALDVNVQRVMIQTLAELRDNLGVSLIVVTHDMAVHAELVDRVAVMYAGDI